MKFKCEFCKKMVDDISYELISYNLYLELCKECMMKLEKYLRRKIDNE